MKKLETAYKTIELARAELYNEKADFSNIDYEKLFYFSQYHDVSAIIADVVLDNITKEKFLEAFNKEKMKALYKYTLQNEAILNLTDIFEKAGIKYIFLKGAALRNFYEKPQIRTSGDIDIFYDGDKTEELFNILKENGFIFEHKCEKDYAFSKDNCVLIEMHHSLFSNEKRYEIINNGVFERAVAVKGKKYGYMMTDADFYLFFIAHFARHLENAGSGLKSIIDLWVIYDNFDLSDKAYINNTLEKLNLVKFESVIRSLSQKLKNCVELTIEEKEVFLFIAESGVYGNVKNKIGVNLNIDKKGKVHKVKYAIKRAFPPYSFMVKRYRFLKKVPFLLPLFYIVRLFSAIFKNNKRVKDEIENLNCINKELVAQKKNAIEILGVKVK